MRAWAASSSQDEEDPPRRLDPVPESSVAGEPSGSEDGTEPKYVSCRIPIFDPSASRGTPRSPPPLPSPAPSPPHPPSPLQLPDAKEPKRLLPSFRPLPSLLVFPNLPLLAFWLFALGITQKATSLLAFASAEGGIACGGGCVLLAALTLIFVAASVLLGLAMLLRFARRYHTACWKPNAKGIRRAQGSWMKPPEDMAEPARTERLLARRSFDPFYEQSADCQQSMSLHLLDGTTGRYRIGVGFAWVGIVMQVMIGLLSGVGPYLSKGGGAAKFQVLAVGGVKLLWASLLACFCPCADLVMNAVTACVFLLEGTSVVMLCIAQWSDEISSELVDSLQIASFVLLLIPVFLPSMPAVYDSIITVLPKLLARSSGGATGASVKSGASKAYSPIPLGACAESTNEYAGTGTIQQARSDSKLEVPEAEERRPPLD